MVSKGGYKRKSMVGTVPVGFPFIETLISKEDKQKYGYSIRGSLSPEDQKLRNKALIVLLYYSARRISELVGRTLKLDVGYDICPGVKVKDFRFDTVKGRDLVIMNVRILKKGKAKRGSIRQIFREVAMDTHWPLMEHFLTWFEHQKAKGPETKMFNINRSRSYQILRALDKKVFNHWLRHQRLSHLGEYLTPFQLNERIGFWEKLDPAISYVHGRMSAYLDAGDKTVK